VGKFVVFEGIDGSGKSTISRMFHEALVNMGVPSILTREPTDGQWGSKIRTSKRDSVIDEELFFKDREDHVRNTILPALESGMIVICDRYYHSSAVYQGTSMGNPHFIISRNEKAFPKPDHLVIVDVPASVAWGRLNKRGTIDNFESGGIMTLEKYRAMYLELFSLRPSTIKVDGTLTPEEILKIVIGKITV